MDRQYDLNEESQRALVQLNPTPGMAPPAGNPDAVPALREHVDGYRS